MRKHLTPILLIALMTACGGRQAIPDRSWLRGLVVPVTMDETAWRVQKTPFYSIRAEGDGIQVSNSSIGSGVTPVLFKGRVPAELALRVNGRLLREGLDGGWGVEFGVGGGNAWRALLYASGRFCLDRLGGEYPEFIHCVSTLPAIRQGEVGNELGLEVTGIRIRIRVNGILVLDLEDERLKPGGLGLAVAGAGTRVRFTEIELRAAAQTD